MMRRKPRVQPSWRVFAPKVSGFHPFSGQFDEQSVISTCNFAVSKRRICELGGIPRLLDLLKSSGDERTMLACLYTLLNLSTEPDNQVGCVSDTQSYHAMVCFIT